MSLTYASNARMEQYNILRGDHEALIEKHRKLSLNTQNLVDKVKLAEQGQKIAENRMAKVESLLKAAEFTISADTDELRDRLEKATDKKQADMDTKNNDLMNVIKNNTMLFGRLQKKYDRTTGDWVTAKNLSVKLQKELQNEKTQTKELSAKLQAEIKKIRADVKASAKRSNKDKKHKGATGKLKDEILDYKSKVVRDSRIIEQLKSELNVTKKDMKGITAKYASNKKDYVDYKWKVEDLEGKLMIMSEKATRLEKEAERIVPENIQVTVLENKYNSVVGKVVTARNKITSLNASTPYRPGQVERTLADLLDGLKNV